MNIFKKIIKIFSKKNNNKAIIISRSEHNISRKNISKNVLSILYKLKQHGYKSYLVGGGVRDLLLQRQPKDFDIATDAHPEKIKKLFRYCYIIGRRFPLVHVNFGKEIVEVVTFRGESNHKRHHSKDGMILRDNIYGNIEEDALRRDFTVNALYYNIYDYSIVDYAGGLKDLYDRKLSLIGEPATRYREDPVRMLRAIRFAAKLDFDIQEATAAPIYALKKLLYNVSSARLYDEYVKLFFYGHAVKSFELLKQYELLEILFPGCNNIKFIINSLKDIDYKISNNQPINPALGIAVLLWPDINISDLKFLEYKHLLEALLSEQKKIINLSKKLLFFIKDIWIMQFKLLKLAGKSASRVKKFSDSNKFTPAFEFLLLRAKSGDSRAQRIANWWKKYLLFKNNEELCKE